MPPRSIADQALITILNVLRLMNSMLSDNSEVRVRAVTAVCRELTTLEMVAQARANRSQYEAFRREIATVGGVGSMPRQATGG